MGRRGTASKKRGQSLESLRNKKNSPSCTNPSLPTREFSNLKHFSSRLQIEKNLETITKSVWPEFIEQFICIG